MRAVPCVAPTDPAPRRRFHHMEEAALLGLALRWLTASRT